MFESYCSQGMSHLWVNQGDGFKYWASNRTDEPPPEGTYAIYRYRCAMCGEERFVSNGR
jgi:hypothetical protein